MGLIYLAGFKMNRPGSSADGRGVKENGDPGGHLSALTSAHTAPVSPETGLLSAFKTHSQDRRVYLAGRGESARPRSCVTVSSEQGVATQVLPSY